MTETTNIHGTDEGNLTVVLPDWKAIRRQLIAKRLAVGAKTPIGHRCSNLVEMLENYQKAEGDQRTDLAKSIRRALADMDGFQ